MDQSEKVALVTGASSGIGRATALAFAQSGVRVVLADISAEAGEGAASFVPPVKVKTFHFTSQSEAV